MNQHIVRITWKFTGLKEYDFIDSFNASACFWEQYFSHCGIIKEMELVLSGKTMVHVAFNSLRNTLEEVKQ